MSDEGRIIKPIAHIRTDLTDKFGIPRQSGRVPSLEGVIVFEREFRSPDALREIETFSHLWLIFDFSESHRDKWSPMVRPPRLGGNRRVGVFASRSPFRPNSLGLSCVKLCRVERGTKDGDVLRVAGVDLLDRTPIYDIKPYIPYADCVPDAVGGYADAEKSHSLEVYFPDELLREIPEVKREALISCIADDPRPSYQEDPEREYTMVYGEHEVDFHISGYTATVYRVRKSSDNFGENQPLKDGI